MIRRYSTYAEFLAEANTLTDDTIYHGEGARSEFRKRFHEHTYNKALHYATVGDDKYVPAAEKLLDELTDVDNGERTTEWSPSVSGAYPVVPEYLAGHPLCMREPRETENLAPLSVYCCTTVDVHVTADQLIARGTAILALVLKLQKIRSVDLYAVVHLQGKTDGDQFIVIPIESKPLSLAHASYALSSVSFTRQLSFKLGCMIDDNQGAFPRHRNDTQWIRKHLGIDDADLYIEYGMSTSPLIRQPVKWVNEQLTRYNSGEICR